MSLSGGDGKEWQGQAMAEHCEAALQYHQRHRIAAESPPSHTKSPEWLENGTPSVRDKQPSSTSSRASPTTTLQRTHVYIPITALAFYSLPGDDTTHPQLLLSGQDTNLKIYSIATSAPTLLASLQIFPSQPIQGLTTCPATHAILLWGGPWLAILPAAHIAHALSSSPAPRASAGVDIHRAPDWIYHAAFTPSGSAAVVVTAHNEVLPLRRCHKRDGNKWCWGRVRAPRSSRPILYAARLECVGEGGEEGGEEVLVVAGTVFGEILVWRCRIPGGCEGNDGEGEEERDVQVLYVFTGHEGSIFGVDISPEVRVGGEKKRLLASCSDDRTIRVWDISACASPWRLDDGDNGDKKAEAITFVHEARETGFGEKGEVNLEAQTGCVSADPVAMAMGHVSRIWNVRFARSSFTRDEAADGIVVYSFGEDATAQRWRLDLINGKDTSPDSQGSDVREENLGNADLAASLTHEATILRHSGKHIWSSAILEPATPGEKTLVATGGSDGRINIAEEMAAEHDTRAVLLDISGTEVVRCFPDAAAPATQTADDLPTKATKRNKARAEDEPFLAYALVLEGPTLATTASGRIFRGTLDGAEMSWSEVAVSREVRDDLRQSHILRSAGVGMALLGSASGNVYVYLNGAVSHVCKVRGKISDIFTFGLLDLVALRLWDCDEWTRMPIMVSTVASPLVTLFIVASTDSGLTVLEEHTIEMDAGFVPTAVGCCDGYFIFGARIGALVVYRPTYREGKKVMERMARIERPLTKDAVSCIIPLPPRAGVAAPYFLTTSRDGRYRIYEVTSPTTTPASSFPINIILRHEALPPLGPMIESAVFAPGGTRPELTLAGFRSKYFVAWNETRQLELATIDCGGAFRSHTHHIELHNHAALSFIWTRGRRTAVYAQTALSQRAVQRGGHGREIKAVAASSEGNLLATGAEDTTVQIWSHHGAAGLRRLAVVERHTTGIQCLRWAAGAKYLLSSSGGEELCVWRVARLDKSAYDGLAVVCEAVYPDRTRDGDLRILGFDVDVLARPHGGEEEEEEADEVLCLSLVLSNSTLKTYRYCRASGFTLLAQGRYTGACLLQTRHLRAAADTAAMHVLTAATDGRIALWKTTAPSAAAHDSNNTAAAPAAVYELVEALALHQSSVKSLDLRPLSPSSSSYVVVTGGDDNALGCVVLTWSAAKGCFAVASRALASGAHAAAVTGLCITGIEREEKQEEVRGWSVGVCTASTDQRVKRWRIGVEEQEGRVRVRGVQLVRNACSGVADAGDLEVLGGGKEAVVVGVGMEVWRL